MDECIIVRWYIVVILRCSTKSLLLLTITSQQFIRSTIMINHRKFTIAYLGSCLLRYDAEPFALRGLRQNDSFVRNQTDFFLSCPSISLLHTRLLDVPPRLPRMHSSEYSAKEP